MAPLARTTPLSEQHEVWFCKFGTMGFGGPFFWLSVKIKSFLPFRAWDGISGMLITVLPCFASLQGVTLIHLHRHGCLGLDNALLCCCCFFTVCTNSNLVRIKVVLFPSFSVLLPLFSQGVRKPFGTQTSIPAPILVSRVETFFPFGWVLTVSLSSVAVVSIYHKKLSIMTSKALDVDISVGCALAILSQLNPLRGKGGWKVSVFQILLRLPLLVSVL